MARVFLSVGSNVDRERNVALALRRLEQHFGTLIVSSVYESEPVGFDGAPFYNLAAGFESGEPPARLVSVLRSIERESGRARGTPKFGPRTLDLDLVLYDDLVLNQDGIRLPRDELTRFAYVLGPMAEICGDMRHPVSGIPIADLWARFDDPSQRVTRLSLDVDALPAQSAGPVCQEPGEARQGGPGR